MLIKRVSLNNNKMDYKVVTWVKLLDSVDWKRQGGIDFFMSCLFLFLFIYLAYLSTDDCLSLSCSSIISTICFFKSAFSFTSFSSVFFKASQSSRRLPSSEVFLRASMEATDKRRSWSPTHRVARLLPRLNRWALEGCNNFIFTCKIQILEFLLHTPAITVKYCYFVIIKGIGFPYYRRLVSYKIRSTRSATPKIRPRGKNAS